MKRTELQDYIDENKLLLYCKEKSGIYAITVDKNIVYIGQSINIYERCSQHIYNTQNAMFNNGTKYRLLLAAHLGGHRVDCYPIKYCDIDELKYWEDGYIEYFDPCLNIATPTGKKDIDSLKIEDILAEKRWQINVPDIKIQEAE